jgi:stage V sporulation protein D (sporulation-specific penicillin-binding protein)
MKRSRQSKVRIRTAPERRISIAHNGRMKLVFTFFIVALALFALGAYLVFIVTGSGGESSKKVLANKADDGQELPFCRGAITDRYGTVLAESVQKYRVIMEPRNILLRDKKNYEATVEALTAVMGCDRDLVVKGIDENPDSYYVQTGRILTAEEKLNAEKYIEDYNNQAQARYRELKTPQPVVTGITFERLYERSYPYESFASDVIGYSRQDASVGIHGLEQYYNEYLAGETGRRMSYITDEGTVEWTYVEPKNGCTLVTTLDHTLQSIAEECISDFFKTYTADNVGILAVDPDNGEILTMAMDRQVNLNDPGKISKVVSSEKLQQLSEQELNELTARIQGNFAVETSYEPGSTAKCLTVAAALEEGAVSQSSRYLCDGGESFGSGAGGTYVRCSGGPHEEVSLAESLVVSCNDALMQVARSLGGEKLLKNISLFGFGRQTGIDLPYENAGAVHTIDNMDDITLATNSFGQNYNVTMVQMAMALCSVVNGGTYYQPHLMKEIVDVDGTVVKRFEPIVMHKTVTKETADFVKNAMRRVVTEGTGTAAMIGSYDVGGKTGTAEKLPRNDKKYLVSFAGIVPADDPALLIYVVVDNPSYQDGSPLEVNASIATALEKSFMEKILPYTDIPKESSE